MILPKKTILLLGLAFSSLIGVMYAASSTVLWHNIRQAEQENTRQSVQGVLRVLTQTQDEFSSRFADWSAWDDTYTFIKDANKDYIASNLNLQTLENLNIDLALFIQPSGEVVYGTSFDRRHLRKTSIPEALRSQLHPQNRLLQHTNSKSSLTGIVLLPEGPMLITSQPIVTSEGKGPIRGTLIFGKYLDADRIKTLSKSTGASLNVHGLNQAQMPPDFQVARHSFSALSAILIRPLNEETIAGYVLLPDIYGKPAVLLRVDVSRDIYKQGKNSLRHLVASLLVVGLVFGVVIMLLLQRLVLFLKQRQQAQEALRQAEAKYRSIFEHAVEGIFQTTQDGHYLSANPALARLYGYESPESLVKSLHKIEQQLYVDPNRRVEFTKLMQQHDAVSGFEAQVYRQDGRIIWISENARAVRDENGVLLYYEGSVEDITEQKQAHEKLESKVAERTTELRQANEQLHSEIVERKRAEEEVRLLQTMTQAISESQDFDSALEVALRQICEFTGWSFGEAWIPGSDNQSLKYSPAWYGNTQSLENFRRLSVNLTIPPVTGLPGRVWSSMQPEWIQNVASESDFLRTRLAMDVGFKAGLGIPIIAYSTLSNEPEVLAVLVFFMFESCQEDKRQTEIVTTVATQLGALIQRKQAEAALRSSEAINRALLNAIPDSIFRISSDGTFVNFKAAKNNPLPLPTEDFLGKNLCEVLPPEVAQSMMNGLELAFSTEEDQICEYQMLVHNQLQDYEARIVVSAENEVMAIIRDITERKQAEQDIRKALTKEKELSELKSRFITMTSHEFRTPLTTILSSTELIQDYGSKWTEEKKSIHLQRIISTVKHMTRLLEEVLLIGKAEAGKLNFSPAPLDLNQFCQELVDEIQITTENHTISFRSQINCTTANMDEKLLRHILSNLLSNAVKYSPNGGTVYFELFCEQGEAVFQVQDQGIGIPVADQAKLFDSFHRATNVGMIAGTGLGLAIVKKSVALHGGRIFVNSEVGIGTTFTVKIPLNNQILLERNCDITSESRD